MVGVFDVAACFLERQGAVTAWKLVYFCWHGRSCGMTAT